MDLNLRRGARLEERQQRPKEETNPYYYPPISCFFATFFISPIALQIEYQRINANRMETLNNPIYINPLVSHLRSSVVQIQPAPSLRFLAFLRGQSKPAVHSQRSWKHRLHLVAALKRHKVGAGRNPGNGLGQ